MKLETLVKEHPVPWRIESHSDGAICVFDSDDKEITAVYVHWRDSERLLVMQAGVDAINAKFAPKPRRKRKAL